MSPKAEEGEDKEKQHLKFSVGKNLKCELSGRPLDTERRMLLMGWRAWWVLGERRVNTSQYPGFPNLTCKYMICTHWGTKKSSKIQGRWVRCDINSLPTLWGVPETHKLPTDSWKHSIQHLNSQQAQWFCIQNIFRNIQRDNSTMPDYRLWQYFPGVFKVLWKCTRQTAYKYSDGADEIFKF